jgi:hypothetical protein
MSRCRRGDRPPDAQQLSIGWALSTRAFAGFRHPLRGVANHDGVPPHGADAHKVSRGCRPQWSISIACDEPDVDGLQMDLMAVVVCAIVRALAGKADDVVATKNDPQVIEALTTVHRNARRR